MVPVRYRHVDPRYLPLLRIASDPSIDHRRLVELVDEAIAPAHGLSMATWECTSEPDGNVIKLNVIRPSSQFKLPCVYYIHGGGMARNSCFDGLFLTWTRLLAHQGVAVVAVDFRNSLEPSSAHQVAPYPAGLNDCVSGLKWLHRQADTLGIDRDRIIVAGESGGGNLSLATGMTLLRQEAMHLIAGLYVSCPFIAGTWPQARFGSSITNDRVLIDARSSNVSAIAYGVEAFDAGDPLAWPSFATEKDVRGLPPTVISVNECDPLRDEGIDFYRLLVRAGVKSQCRQLVGVVHMGELFTTFAPEISVAVAADVARFCRQPSRPT